MLPRKRSEAKLGVKWQIRIGDFDHQSSLDDADVVILDVTNTDIHPDYNNDTAYFDVGILKTALFEFNKVNGKIFNSLVALIHLSITYATVTVPFTKLIRKIVQMMSEIRFYSFANGIHLIKFF